MSESDCLKLNVHYGGLLHYKDNKFKYNGGHVKKGMVIDPDYMTWSLFDDFCDENGYDGGVEQVWYKLPHEDIELARSIYGNIDSEIRQMCSEALCSSREVDVYIKHAVSNPTPVPLIEWRNEDAHHDECGNEGDGSESDFGNNDEGVEEGEDIVQEGGDDPRFESFFDEVRNEDGVSGVEKEAPVAEDVSDAEKDECNEEEFERQCIDDDHPEPVIETDDEWEVFNRKETEMSRRTYQKDKPPYLWLLQTFKSGEEFKEQLLRYVLKTQYDVKLCRWEKTKLAAVCVHEKCEWKIYCSVEKPKRKWMVKVYVDRHNHVKSGKARMLKQGTIASLYKDEARRRPGLKWSDIKDEIMMRYKISVSKWICTKARRIALDMVIASQKEQFAKLWDYEAELKRSNPNTTTEIVTIPREDGKQVFDRFYICFEALRNTWLRCCRPIIGLDGAFMKWELKGEILAAVGRDSDNRIYPIAWAIVRVEDNDSWAWFVDKLKTDLRLGLGDAFTVISDKQKGLINAVSDLLPHAEHRHCARHIFANWKKVYGQIEYESYFWAVAYSSTMGDYEYNMNALKEYDEDAYEDLLKTSPKSWCRAYFSRNARCEDVCNNLSESFNRTIKEARKKPLIDMLEEIRRLTMKRISRRFSHTSKCQTQFPPNIMNLFESNRQDSRCCTVIKSSESLYEVVEGEGSYEVCLRYKHCACNQWDITGIPCRHAIHVIAEHNRDPANFVDNYYLTTKWQDTYRDNIKPVNGERLWKKTGRDPILVPEKRRMPGRPKKYDRIKEAHESSSNPTKATREGRTMTCSNCKQGGHNKSTCNKERVILEGPKRKRGRPRKIHDDDPWSIQNAPKRRRNASSQPTPTAPITSHTPNDTQPSSVPPPSSYRGRGHRRGRGREREPPIPRGYGCYISPWTGRIFYVWGSSAVDVTNTQPRAPPNQDS